MEIVGKRRYGYDLNWWNDPILPRYQKESGGNRRDGQKSEPEKGGTNYNRPHKTKKRVPTIVLK